MPAPGVPCSLLLNVEEMLRPENDYDRFSRITSRAAVKIASYYDVSVADVLAICSAVGIELLSNNRVKILSLGTLRVGRMDSLKASPPNQLPPANATTQQFASFWQLHKFSQEEAVALMGSHSLIDDQVGVAQEVASVSIVCLDWAYVAIMIPNPTHLTQGCLLPDGRTLCDPYRSECTNLRMFTWGACQPRPQGASLLSWPVSVWCTSTFPTPCACVLQATTFSMTPARPQ
jgi:hypothetical protein